MFTVRIYSNFGNESLYPATNVFAEGSENVANAIKSVTVNMPDGASVTVYDGNIFVMNENGKTVATYYLSKNLKAAVGGDSIPPTE